MPTCTFSKLRRSPFEQRLGGPSVKRTVGVADAEYMTIRAAIAFPGACLEDCPRVRLCGPVTRNMLSVEDVRQKCPREFRALVNSRRWGMEVSTLWSGCRRTCIAVEAVAVSGDAGMMLYGSAA